MSGIHDPLAWVAKAEEDYAVACSSLRRKPPFVYTACFHAQQCAEKYLKAMLVAQKKTFSKTHDLLALKDQCEKAGIVLTIDARALNALGKRSRCHKARSGFRASGGARLCQAMDRAGEARTRSTESRPTQKAGAQNMRRV